MNFDLRSTPKLRFEWGVVIILWVAYLAVTTAFAAEVQRQPDCDLVILHGRVMNPETNLDEILNIGVKNGKIVALTADRLHGKRTIEARGLVVSPGFIDLHRHGQSPTEDALTISDGVTTALELEIGTADVDQWYKDREGKALVNFGVSIGHIPVRAQVFHDTAGMLPTGNGAHRQASEKELAQIQSGVEHGLQRGALAVGMGPAYTPEATSWEIYTIFKIASRYGASVHVHIRAASPKLATNMAGFDEVLADAVASGASLHIVHLQSTGGPNAEHELAMIHGARARGMDVTTEAYPYGRGATEIESAMFDHKEDEPEEYYASLLWPATGEYLTHSTFLRYRKTGGIVIVPTISEEMLRAVVADPLPMIASDGGSPNGHPRTMGTYSKVLGEYVREQHALPLMAALCKMTLMPAQRLEQRAPMMRRKGRIEVGADADITIFNLARIQDASTYRAPMLPSVGIEWVLVNGIPVIDKGELIPGVAPGVGVRAPVQ